MNSGPYKVSHGTFYILTMGHFGCKVSHGTHKPKDRGNHAD